MLARVERGIDVYTTIDEKLDAVISLLSQIASAIASTRTPMPMVTVPARVRPGPMTRDVFGNESWKELRLPPDYDLVFVQSLDDDLFMSTDTSGEYGFSLQKGTALVLWLDRETPRIYARAASTSTRVVVWAWRVVGSAPTR